MRADYPATHPVVLSLRSRQRSCNQHKQREIGRKGVVLLVRRDGEEDQDQPRKDSKQEACLRRTISHVELQPALSPSAQDRQGYKQAPWEQPHQVQRPKEIAW